MACRTARPKRELVRIVRTPDGRVLVDPSGRLAGRGAYLCHQSTCLDLAKKKRALDRALETSVPAELLAGLAIAATEPSKITQGGIHGQE